MRARVVGDLSVLPPVGFRSHSLWGWAVMAFMIMEGMGFALAGGAYLYLMSNAGQWPLDGKPPDLLWGTLLTVLLVASLAPNYVMSRVSRKRQTGPTKMWATVLLILNTIALAIRGVEFAHLNVRWDQDAFGSITWALMLLHTTHLVTDFVDTFFLVVVLFTHPIDTERFSDVDDDAVYWAFVVFAWIPLYLLVYWAPRILR